MSWKHWVAVVLVIGLGIVLQMRGHDDEAMEEHRHTDHAATPAAPGDAPAGPYRTVALEVTGMT